MEELIKHKMVYGIIQERKKYIEEVDRIKYKNRVILNSMIREVKKAYSNNNLYIYGQGAEGLFIAESNILQQDIISVKYIKINDINGYIILENKLFSYHGMLHNVFMSIEGNIKGILRERNETIKVESLGIINRQDKETEDEEFYIDNRIDINRISIHDTKYIKKIEAEYIYLFNNVKSHTLISKSVSIDNDKEHDTIIEILNTDYLYLPASVKGNIKISILAKNRLNHIVIDKFSTKFEGNSYDNTKKNILRISTFEVDSAVIDNIPNIKIKKFIGKKMEIYINIQNTNWQNTDEYTQVIKESFIEINTCKNKDYEGNYPQKIDIIIDCKYEKFTNTRFYYIKNNESYEQKYNNEMRNLKKVIKEYVKVKEGKDCVVTTNIIIKENNGHKIEFDI